MKRIRSFTRTIFKTFFNFPAWFGFKEVKQHSKYVFGLFKIKIKKIDDKKSFVEIVQDLNLSESDIEGRVKRLTTEFLVFLAITIFCIIYMVILFAKGFLIAGCLAIGLFAILVIKTCSIHFFLFQINKRRLDCTIKEWLKELTNFRIFKL